MQETIFSLVSLKLASMLKSQSVAGKKKGSVVLDHTVKPLASQPPPSPPHRDVSRNLTGEVTRELR
jgi:hypothetical protein